ncbi:MAG: isoleucine--tRNA ligase [Gammaproteobacteria bacterium]
MSKDAKQQLNLPQTALPMRANLAKNEPAICSFWASEQMQDQVKQAMVGRQGSFLLHDGPPYANGDIHTGHAINKILKDVICKSRLLDGLSVSYVPGWDCHGLPIEMKIEEQLGDRKVDAAHFQDMCREYVKEQVARQKKDFVRLGIWGDWHRPYLTQHSQYEADELRALARIVQRGHLVKGLKPVHWCTACGSALAEAEVEYSLHHSTAVDVGFEDASGALARLFHLPKNTRVALAAWTTTPWTLPANEAVCVHANYEYCAIWPASDDSNDPNETDQPLEKAVIVSAELKEQIAQRLEWQHFGFSASLKGSELEGIRVQHPFQAREVPILTADHVTLDIGTGAVHTAPAHGLDDWYLGQAAGLKVEQLVAADGTYIDSLETLGGLSIWEAETVILELMAQKGTLLCAQSYEHSYPHCWRHQMPLIFRATPQWFISMQKAGLLSDVLEAVQPVQFVPDTGSNRFLSMLAERPDWCISRQRIWGVPLALFQHSVTGEAHPDTAEILMRVADRIEQQGIKVWEEISVADYLPEADQKDYVKCSDVLDVWFDSGASHYCVLDRDERLFSPADVYLEGSDQHRGWFQSSALTAIAMGKEIPYKTVITHGFLVDSQGNKMSKSKGNGLLPDEICNQWGADILRLWVASTDYRREMVLSESVLKNTADIYRRVRNTLRFLLGNLYDFDPAQHAASVQAAGLLPLDQWALQRAATIQSRIQDAYASYELHTASRLLHEFCAEDMGAFYLDILKDRLYTCATDSHARRSAQFVLHHVLQALIRWMAPILSFTAEEVWAQLHNQLAKRPTVLAEVWHSIPVPESPSNIDWDRVRGARRQINLYLEQARQEKRIRSSLAAHVTLYSPELIEALEPFGEEARFILLVSGVEYAESGERGADPAVLIRPAVGSKCPRCWHVIESELAESQQEDPPVCSRCQSNLSGPGEYRQYA